MSKHDFHCERVVKKPRRDRICETCRKTIPAGTETKVCTGVYEGDFMSYRYHVDCWEAEKWYNNQNAPLPWDDPCYLFEIFDNNIVDEFRYLCHHFPAVAERMGADVHFMKLELGADLT